MAAAAAMLAEVVLFRLGAYHASRRPPTTHSSAKPLGASSWFQCPLDLIPRYEEPRTRVETATAHVGLVWSALVCLQLVGSHGPETPSSPARGSARSPPALSPKPPDKEPRSDRPIVSSQRPRPCTSGGSLSPGFFPPWFVGAEGLNAASTETSGSKVSVEPHHV